ncbi:MAG: 4-hydroxy-3-methylbut-2-enyl diphosphate reductase [Clostridia bacterium]|nr:4-hydroxy-3-methylbut-2-enyl diphosphate reductase [Clostridia bacterium]
MKIIVGKNAGFCYGVRNAVESAKKDLENTKESIFFLGDIVHNKQVIDELKKQGAVFVEDILEAKGTTIIRAHGIPKEIYEIAKKNNIVLKDYTCPNVLKIHKIAEEYANKGYYILLFGERKHPENIGTVSYCGDKFFVIEDEEGLYNAIDILNNWKVKDVLVLSQTTFNRDTFYTFQGILRDELNKDINLVINNTICNATNIRQQETEELAQNVDCMIIIGGRNSSNTKKLYEIAEEYGKSAICIETKEDIKNVDFSLFNTIGIMAGASTPQSSIDEIYEALDSKYN